MLLHVTGESEMAKRELYSAFSGGRISMSELLRELLENSMTLLCEGLAATESLDSLAVLRELAAASIATLGDFWTPLSDRLSGIHDHVAP
jgi:hypothetical protein